jgi:hypothetical protein
MYAHEEIGTDVLELDGSLCTSLWEDKKVLVKGLLGGYYKVIVDAQHNASNDNVYCILHHWENLDTIRKNYICTCVIDKMGIEKAEF